MHIQIYKLSALKNITCWVVCVQVEVSTDQIKTKKYYLYFEVHYEVVQELQPLLLAGNIY